MHSLAKALVVSVFTVVFVAPPAIAGVAGAKAVSQHRRPAFGLVAAPVSEPVVAAPHHVEADEREETEPGRSIDAPYVPPPSAAPAPPPSAPPESTPAPTFSAHEAARAVDDALVSLPICNRGEVAGPGVAEVRWAADGSVASVALAAPYARTATGACVARRLVQARIAPFTGDGTIRIRFVL